MNEYASTKLDAESHAEIARMVAENRHLKAEIAELKRQLELAKSDALIRPSAAPGFNYHQGGSS